ncbi:hypothetical protein QBC38DRAFT_492553 [Podospora fimiseda]|uniref:SHSP domain-containing protein n=1 Tax=Podospora fimiseda TaxID=252190 RepID=A0AAN6YQY9_9PEZI|nr:hypothetical protein QBC38DRAFT_492553 [Podospora fimiseda]
MSAFEFALPSGLYFEPAYSHTQHQPSLVPLFRMLDEWDQAQSQAEKQQQHQQQPRKAKQCPAKAAQPKAQTQAQPKININKAVPVNKLRVERFRPAFDVFETQDAYELYGELPGTLKENINIEFKDPQTIAISGKVERRRLVPAVPAVSQIEGSQSVVQEEQEQERPRSPYQATVEDTDDEEFENLSSLSNSRRGSKASVDSEKMEVDTVKPVEETKEEEEKPQVEEEGKQLLKERVVGEFERMFTFPEHVEQEGVSASLENGVLSVRVPKKRIVLPKAIRIF